MLTDLIRLWLSSRTFARTRESVDERDVKADRQGPITYEVEEVKPSQRSARAERTGSRGGIDETEIQVRAHEDQQDAEAFTLLFYTGQRLGELLTLRWNVSIWPVASLFIRGRVLADEEERVPKEVACARRLSPRQLWQH